MEGCLPSEKTDTTMAHLEVMPSQLPPRWGHEEPRFREIKASVENVVGEDEVSAKTASLEKKRFSRRSFLRMADLSCL